MADRIAGPPGLSCARRMASMRAPPFLHRSIGAIYVAGGDFKETAVACSSTRPGRAEDALEYFTTAVTVPPRVAQPAPVPTALQQMYGYYTADQA